MTRGHIILTAFEWLFGIGLVIGFFNEDRIIRFEERFVQRRRAKKSKYETYNPREGICWR